MSKKIKKIKDRDCARMLLTDVLPYELPLYFTNEKLYKFAKSNTNQTPLISKILSTKGETIPASLKIGKIDQKTRTLSIIHPATQLRASEFYRKYDIYISHLCTRSAYSLRHPYRVASKFYDSRYIDESLNEFAPELVEGSFEPEKPYASTYFSYKTYAQIYKFFSSREYELLEQEYKYMAQLDIAKCFSSIYTHSIAWSMRGKTFAKDNRGLEFFESEFDKLVGNFNWGETNGIIIGPEICRIFAEIILQSVDIAISKKVQSKTTIKRYVDDYFIFSNDLEDLQTIERVIAEELEKYNLYLNESKKKIIERPLITNLTIARNKIQTEVLDFINLFKSALGSVQTEAEQSKSIGELKKQSRKIITEIRSVARTNQVKYADLASPALAIIARKMNTIRYRSKPSPGETSVISTKFESTFQAVLTVSEFLYLMDIRAATSNKMARIFLELDELARSVGLARPAFESQILDITRKAIIESKKHASTADVLNIAVAADSICSDKQKLTKIDLQVLFSVTDENSSSMNDYFSIIAALYFSKNRRDLRPIKQAAIKSADHIIMNNAARLNKNTDAFMLFVDIIGCPYIDEADRAALYNNVHKISQGRLLSQGDALGQARLLSKSNGFTVWQGVSSLRSLLAKKDLRPAYE